MRKLRISRPIQIVAAVIALSLLTWSLVYAITLDGYNTSSEWDGINPSVDEETDETGVTNNSVDIRDVYFTCSDTTLYARIDTWAMPPGHTTDPLVGVQIYFDTDANSTTGCNASVAATRHQGYESRIRHFYDQDNLVWRTRVDRCVSGAWSTPVGNGATTVVDILEVSASLSDLNLTCGESMHFFVYYDGGTSDIDDEVPDGGSANLITLASLTATAQDGSVRVAWETASEIDNAGFNVYRANQVTGSPVKLNSALIAAQGGPAQGASYTFDDMDVSAGGTYFYTVEDVDLHGNTTVHGPVSVTVGEMPTAVRVQGLSASSALPVGLLAVVLVGAMVVVARRRRQ